VTVGLALLKERNACWETLKWGTTKDLSHSIVDKANEGDMGMAHQACHSLSQWDSPYSRRRNACWETLKWGTTKDLSLPLQEDLRELRRGLFAQSHLLAGTLRLHRLPLQYRNIHASSWRILLLSNNQSCPGYAPVVRLPPSTSSLPTFCWWER
jgi:hypothetical protein